MKDLATETLLPLGPAAHLPRGRCAPRRPGPSALPCAPHRTLSASLATRKVTDGEDMQSPAPYCGMDGMNPLMASLLRAGFRVEWSIILIGRQSSATKVPRAATRLCGRSRLRPLRSVQRLPPPLRPPLSSRARGCGACHRPSTETCAAPLADPSSPLTTPPTGDDQAPYNFPSCTQRGPDGLLLLFCARVFLSPSFLSVSVCHQSFNFTLLACAAALAAALTAAPAGPRRPGPFGTR